VNVSSGTVVVVVVVGVRNVHSCVVLLARYNHRIKTYMRDVNAVKKASSDNSRAINCFNRAIDSFWPDKSALMKTRLLEHPDSPDDSEMLKSGSAYEKALSFRQLVTGVICVWQECWNLLQTVKNKTMGNEPLYLDQVSGTVDQLKTDLAREIDRRCYGQVVQCTFSLHAVFLHLHAQRMRTFMKNPRLVAILDSFCLSNPLVRYTTVESLWMGNLSLRSNFRIYQRDNIEDFLEHLEQYFQPKMKDSLARKTWLICEQGRSLHWLQESLANAKVNA